MYVSTNSWHYRWFKFVFDWAHPFDRFNEPTNLCAYFWRFIGTNLYGLFKLTFFSALWAIIPVLLWSAFHNHSHGARGFLFAILVVAVALLVVILLFVAGEKLGRYAKQDIRKGESLFAIAVGAARAKKKKYCPTILYTNSWATRRRLRGAQQ